MPLINYLFFSHNRNGAGPMETGEWETMVTKTIENNGNSFLAMVDDGWMSTLGQVTDDWDDLHLKGGGKLQGMSLANLDSSGSLRLSFSLWTPYT